MIYTTCMKLRLLTNKSTKSVQKQISVQKCTKPLSWYVELAAINKNKTVVYIEDRDCVLVVGYPRTRMMGTNASGTRLEEYTVVFDARALGRWWGGDELIIVFCA